MRERERKSLLLNRKIFNLHNNSIFSFKISIIVTLIVVTPLKTGAT